MDAETKLLIHSDNTDGSTDFVDSSLSEHNITASGSVEHSDDKSKFGSSSILFAGATANYLSVPYSSDFSFGSGSFTIDFWLNVTGLTNYGGGILGCLSGGNAGWGIAVGGSNYVAGSIRLFNGAWSIVSTNTVTPGTWSHVAIVGNEGVVTIYIDGVACGSATTDLNNAASLALSIGNMYASPSSAWPLNGYIDELRISNGVARWTGNFTPPDAPYGDESASFDPADANRIKFIMPASSAFDDTTESAVPVYLSSGSGVSIFDLTRVFDDLGGNSDKIAVLNSDEDTQYQIEVVSWDAVAETAQLLVLLPAWSAGNEFVFCYDATEPDNTDYIVTDIGTSAAWVGDLLTWSEYSIVYDTMRQMMVMSFGVLAQVRQQLDLYYGEQMRRIVKMYFGNYPIMRQLVKLHFGNNPIMRQMVRLSFASAEQQRQRTALEWGRLDPVRQLQQLVFSIADVQMRQQVQQQFDLMSADEIRQMMLQYYSAAAGGSEVRRYDISVYITNDDKTRLIVSYVYLMRERDAGAYHLNFELKLKSYDEFLQFKHLETLVTVVVGDQVSYLLPFNPYKSRAVGDYTYIVPLVSRAKLLEASDSAYSSSDGLDEISGMLSTIFTMLASPVCSVDLQIEDTYIKPGRFYANGETRMALIKKVAASRKAIVQSDDDGNLIIRKFRPKSFDVLASSSPDKTVCDQLDFYSMDQSVEAGDDYNCIYVSDQSSTDGGERIEHEQISSDEYLVKVYLVPWDDDAVVNLLHSGGAHVVVLYNGVVNKLISGEEVEFVNGETSLSKPVYGIDELEWEDRDLGEIEYLEEGNLTADVADNSLATISYYTKYHAFTVINQQSERLQVYPEVI